MRILLDECVPAPLRSALGAHECATAQSCGWAGVKNGDLLRLAETAGFEVFLTADKNLRYQQNLAGRRLVIVELSTNDLRRLHAAAPEILGALRKSEPGCYCIVDVP